MIFEPYLFTVHQFTVTTRKFGQPIYLYPLSDVHRYCAFHDKDAFKAFNDKCKARIDNGDCVVFGLMGDEIEGMSRSERAALMNPDFHSEHFDRLSNQFKAELDDFADTTSYMRGRIGWMLDGNHRGVIRLGKDGWQNSTDYLAQQYNKKLQPDELRAVNLGGMALIHMSITAERTNKTTAIDILAVHGETIGGGRTKGGSINAVVKLRDIADANLYLAGHNHDKQATGDNPLRLTMWRKRPHMLFRPVRYVRCGGYRRGYMVGADNYVARQHRPPAVIGTPEIEITPVRKRMNKEEYISVRIEVNNV